MKKRPASEDEKILFKKTVEQTMPQIVAKSGTKESSAKGTVRRSGLDGNTRKKLQKGMLSPTARLDLHGFTQEAAHRALRVFLPQSHKSSVRLALIVTGASGILKQMVPRWLNQPEFAAVITGIEPAHLRHGGAGALYVYLRK